MAADKKRILLCMAGGCPYVEIDGDNVVFFDDSGKLLVEKTSGGIRITMPKDWIKKANEFK